MEMSQNVQWFLNHLKIFLQKIKLNELNLKDFEELNQITESFGTKYIIDDLYYRHGFKDHAEYHLAYRRVVLARKSDVAVFGVRGGIIGVVEAIHDQVKLICK